MGDEVLQEKKCGINNAIVVYVLLGISPASEV